MEPVSIIDIADFIQLILDVFGVYLVYIFSIMVTFSLLFGIRKLILGRKTS